MVNSDDDLKRTSFCYGCGGKLRSYSLLVCPECLDDQCKNYENLVKETPDFEPKELKDI